MKNANDKMELGDGEMQILPSGLSVRGTHLDWSKLLQTTRGKGRASGDRHTGHSGLMAQVCVDDSKVTCARTSGVWVHCTPPNRIFGLREWWLGGFEFCGLNQAVVYARLSEASCLGVSCFCGAD
jgi:hypothetical protein